MSDIIRDLFVSYEVTNSKFNIIIILKKNICLVANVHPYRRRTTDLLLVLNSILLDISFLESIYHVKKY